MKKNSNDRLATSGKKLTLDKQTLKALTSNELTQFAGGATPGPISFNECPP